MHQPDPAAASGRERGLSVLLRYGCVAAGDRLSRKLSLYVQHGGVISERPKPELPNRPPILQIVERPIRGAPMPPFAIAWDRLDEIEHRDEREAVAELDRKSTRLNSSH